MTFIGFFLKVAQIQPRQISRCFFHLIITSVIIIITFRQIKQQSMFTKTTSSTFDQNSFEITCDHGLTQLEQIKIKYKWLFGEWKYRLPQLVCKWFNKTDTSMEEIEGVIEETYQPSILDVGTTIYLQIVPESREMEYIGMPISKFIGPLKLNSQTEEQVKEMIQAGKSTYFVQVTQLKVKGQGKMKAEQGSVILKDSLLKILSGKVVLLGKWMTSQKSQTIIETEICRNYPKITLDRRNSRQLTVQFNQDEYAKITLQNHMIRDVFYLVLQRNKQIKPETNEEENEVEEKEQIKDKSVKSEEILKKSQEVLPLSPQTQVFAKETKNEKVFFSEKKERRSVGQEMALNLYKNTMENQISSLKKTQEQLKEQIKSVQKQKQRVEQEAVYHKNESRILREKLQEEKQKSNAQEQKIKSLETKAIITTVPKEQVNQKYAPYIDLSFNEILQKLTLKDEELKQVKYKTNYYIERIQNLEYNEKEYTQKIQQSKGKIKHLQKKVQSLAQAKSILSDEISTTHTHSHQIGSYEFEIGKLKEENNILKTDHSKVVEQNTKEIQFLKIQVKELIEENNFLRSKDKSAKGELKNEIVQMKKLVNRFGQSLAEKDMIIDQLKMTNKELNKELVQAKQNSK